MPFFFFFFFFSLVFSSDKSLTRILLTQKKLTECWIMARDTMLKFVTTDSNLPKVD